MRTHRQSLRDFFVLSLSDFALANRRRFSQRASWNLTCNFTCNDSVLAVLTGAAEGHVVPKNFDFFAVLFDDGERVVRGDGLD